MCRHHETQIAPDGNGFPRVRNRRRSRAPRRKRREQAWILRWPTERALGRPGRTLGHPTTELDVPLRKPDRRGGALAQRAAPAGLARPPRGQAFQGSGGIAPDGSVPGGSLVALTFEQRGKLRDIIASQSDAQESSAKLQADDRRESPPRGAVAADASGSRGPGSPIQGFRLRGGQRPDRRRAAKHPLDRHDDPALKGWPGASFASDRSVI